MKTALLHLGTHKTASTAIQLFLRANAGNLAKLGVCYPEPPSPPRAAHHAIPWDLMKAYTDEEQRPSNYVLDQALADFEASGCANLLLSSEDFLAPTFHDGYLEGLFGRLRAQFDRVLVAAFVRGRKGFFTSSYNQWVKALRYDEEVDHYLANIAVSPRAPIRYTQALSRWADAADQHVFIPYRPGDWPHGIERELVARLAIGGGRPRQFGRLRDTPANPSIGPLAVFAFRQLTRALDAGNWFRWSDLPRRAEVRDEAIRRAGVAGWNDTRFTMFDSRRLELVRGAYLEEDRAFARRFFDADWDEVFPEDSEPDAVTECSAASLDPGQLRDVEEFVVEMTDFARDVYA